MLVGQPMPRRNLPLEREEILPEPVAGHRDFSRDRLLLDSVHDQYSSRSRPVPVASATLEKALPAADRDHPNDDDEATRGAGPHGDERLRQRCLPSLSQQRASVFE